MELVYTEPTPDARERVYARIRTETSGDAGTLSSIRFGTVPAEHVTREPVQRGEDEPGRIALDEIEQYYAAEIKKEFQERPLHGFVEELVERTPYTEDESEVVVTHGWFQLSKPESIRVISQHLRGPYEELSRESFDRTLDAAIETKEEIENARKYPFCF